MFLSGIQAAAFYASDSISTARVNTTRLGYYYYETHIRIWDLENRMLPFMKN